MGISAAIVGALAAVGTGTAQAVQANKAADEQKKAREAQLAEQQDLLKKRREQKILTDAIAARDNRLAALRGDQLKTGGRAGTISAGSIDSLGTSGSAGQGGAKTLIGQ